MSPPRAKVRIHSSFSSNSGSVEKSHAIVASPLVGPRANVVDGRARRPRPQGHAASRASSSAKSALVRGFDRDLDLHLLTDEHAAGLQRLVPGENPVVAVDFRRGREADVAVAPGITGCALYLEGQHDG